MVLNQPTARSYLTEEENSKRLLNAKPVLLVLGGDDGLPRDTRNVSFGELRIYLSFLNWLDTDDGMIDASSFARLTCYSSI